MGRTAGEILLEIRRTKKELLSEGEDSYAQEMVGLRRGMQQLLSSKPDPVLPIRILQAKRAMQLFNHALTLHRALKTAESQDVVDSAERELPPYWDGYVPYSRNEKLSPFERNRMRY